MENKIKDFKFIVRERSFLNAAACSKMLKDLYDLGFYDQQWSDTLKSIEENGELHTYLSGDLRFKGRQKILRWDNEDKDLFIILITTVDVRTGTVKRTGSGWPIIIDLRNKNPYFGFQLRRTLRYTERMVKVAELFIQIVKNWPSCPACKEKLQLVIVPGLMLMRAFTCLNKKKHFIERPHFYITAMELSEEWHHMLKDRYDNYYMYRDADFAEGNVRGYACVIRSQKKKGKEKKLRALRLPVREDSYDDVMREPKNGETHYYNDGPHTE